MKLAHTCLGLLSLCGSAALLPSQAPPAAPKVGPAQDGDNLLGGTITESQYMGPFTEYMVDAAGAVLRVHADIDLPVGAKVRVAAAPNVTEPTPSMLRMPSGSPPAPVPDKVPRSTAVAFTATSESRTRFSTPMLS